MADVVEFLLSDRSSYINGETIFADGGVRARNGWAAPATDLGLTGLQARGREPAAPCGRATR